MFDIQETLIENIQVANRTRKEVGSLESLCHSIQSYGLLNPILINDKQELLAGERRLRAFQQMEATTIPARILPGLTSDDCLMIELIENHERMDFTWAEELELKAKLHNYWKTSNGQWGYRETASKLGVSLGGLSSDLALAEALDYFPELKDMKTKGKAREAYKRMQSSAEAITAVQNLSPEEQEKIAQMMDRTTEVLAQKKQKAETSPPEGETPSEDAIPSARHADTPIQSADLTDEELDEIEPSGLPDHVYKICSYEEFLPGVPENIVGFAELDPPYAINYEYAYHDDTPEDADWTLEQLETAMDFIFKHLMRLMLDDSWVLCWTGYEHILWIQDLAKSHGFHIQHPGIWYKPNGGRTATPTVTMKSSIEHFLLFRKGKAQFATPSFNNAQVCETMSGDRLHKWEKPIDLYRKFFHALARPGAYFLSPFAGSGNSMITSTFFNMTPLGCDTSNKHFYHFYRNLKRYHMEG